LDLFFKCHLFAVLQSDEPNKCLFYMRRWAQGTGDAQVFRWDHERGARTGVKTD
jgi:hypothetical protein